MDHASSAQLPTAGRLLSVPLRPGPVRRRRAVPHARLRAAAGRADAEPPHIDPEAPELLAGRAIAPDPLSYDFVGELYEKIRQGFLALPESDLFIGPSAAQVTDTWWVRLDLRPVADQPSALAAIDDIIEDGEGAASDRDTSHYGRFLAIRRAYAEAGYFAAARPVVRNPLTRVHHGTSGPGVVLTHELSRPVAELFNGVYATALFVLQQFFAFGGETEEQREALGRR